MSYPARRDSWDDASPGTASSEQAPPAGRRPRHLAPSNRGRISRSLLATVPIVLVGSIAMSVGLASPARAENPVKRSAKSKTTEGEVGRGAKEARDTKRTRLAAPHPAESVQAPPQQYVVTEGDTVSSVAARFGLSTASILALNGLSWKSLIFPGQVLLLTEATLRAPAQAPVAASIARYTVLPGDTISGIAAAHGLSTAAVLSANGLSSTSVIFPGQAIALPDTAATALAPAPVAVTAPVPPAAPPAFENPVAQTDVALTDVALTDEMRQNARTIIAVGRRVGVGDRGLIIALAAALQESGLRNLDHGDQDSLGLFQQRPSTGWGPPAQILNPTISAAAFFGGPINPNPGRTRGLLDIPGWEAMTVAQAAQSVQLSAHPDAYARWEALARAWLGELG